MSVSYKILKGRALVTVTVSGEADLDETVRSLDRLFADPRNSLEYDMLWDASGLTTEFSSQDLQELLRHFKFYHGEKNPKRAIVVPPAIHHAMTRVADSMATISSRAQIGLFDSRAEALRWLKR